MDMIHLFVSQFVDMNAKGVILKAFDQYRLKTCIDFTPWNGEANYISVFKGSGWASNFKLDIDEMCQVLIKCFLVESVSECNTTAVKTNPRFLSQFVRCNAAWCANYKQNSPQQFDVLNPDINMHVHAFLFFLPCQTNFAKSTTDYKNGLKLF